MKKKLFLLLIPFLISGCTASYNIEIKNDYIIENVSVVIPEDEASEYNNFDDLIKKPIYLYLGAGKTYKSDIKFHNTDYYIKYNYKHTVSDYKNSTFLNKCYAESEVEVTDRSINIYTDSVFQCIMMEDGLRADNVDVKIKTKLKVLNNNADEVNKNVYIWHMNASNYLNKPINIILEKNSSSAGNINSIFSNNFSVFLFICIAGLFGVALLIYLYIKFRNDKNNKL